MRWRRKRMVCLRAWLICALPAAALHAELKPGKSNRNVLSSLMTLKLENQSGARFVGSAVLALADDVAITAWHVVCNTRAVWPSLRTASA